ncbi:unnamed protein product [Darwinula stevensoni]|uniref:Ig-like domain-containing protein n=1 Tax=Darwinula stevensoni TaxID=69355 RepID=A0A7R9A568_9CRUS|nr:unnamed protein product [Darwinula stevensoni]CAG0891467.1 unnamed protein product [Darwinula stevensoni]
MATLQFVTTQRGHRPCQVILDGYIYLLDMKLGQKTYWRCEDRTCTSRLHSVGDVIVRPPSEHYPHAPSSSRVTKVMSDVRRLALVSESSTRNIIVRRKRQRQLGDEDDEDGLCIIPRRLQCTTDGQSFLNHSGENLAFASERALSFLAAADHCPQYQRTVAGLLRTNNSVEGWHNAFSSSVNKAHPSVRTLALKLQREEASATALSERLGAGHQLPMHQKKSPVERQSENCRFWSANEFGESSGHRTHRTDGEGGSGRVLAGLASFEGMMKRSGHAWRGRIGGGHPARGGILTGERSSVRVRGRGGGWAEVPAILQTFSRASEQTEEEKGVRKARRIPVTRRPPACERRARRALPGPRRFRHGLESDGRYAESNILIVEGYLKKQLMSFGSPGAGLEITYFHVPSAVQNGSEAVLVCDYSYMDHEKDSLRVQWYFRQQNGGEADGELVYEWLGPDGGLPRAVGVLEGKIDLQHDASLDPYKMHSDLKILSENLHLGLSGDFTCLVASEFANDSRTGSLLVYAPTRRLLFTKVSEENGTVTVRCLADGMQPEPTMDIFLSLDENRTRIPTHVETTWSKDGLFGMESETTVTLPSSYDPLGPAASIQCMIKIPEAKYTTSRFIELSSGPEYGSGMEDARLQQGDEDRYFQALPDLIVDRRTIGRNGSGGREANKICWSLLIGFVYLISVC